MPIWSLPPEILTQVFTFLSDADVFSARRSTRCLERASLAHFGKRYFRKKGYLITRRSLQVLQNIAAHDELRKYPQHVWFNPDCYTFITPRCAPTDEDSGPRNALLEKQYSAYQECIEDHADLLWNRRLRPELAQAFRHLPNLQTIGMRRSEDYNPYGWTILQQAVGKDPRVLGPIPSTPHGALSGSTQLLIAILQSLADSHRKIQRLYTDAVEIDNINSTSLPHETLQSACNSILYIELNAVKARLVHHARPATSDAVVNCSPGSGLSRLLAAMPNLQELGLQIFRDRKQSHLVAPRPRDPSSWKDTYPFLALQFITSDLLTPSPAFANLTRIKLEKVTATSSILRALLTPCAKNLTSIKMRDIRLLSSSSPSSSPSSTIEEPRPWATIFSFLSTSCPNLSYILFYHLLHDLGGVSFTPSPPLANPDELEEFSFLIEHVPPSHGGEAVFSKYEHLNLEVRGREAVAEKLRDVIAGHWYEKPLFSYAMDEELWHTDTSDEEW